MTMISPSPSTLRRVIGMIRVAAGLLVLVALITQVVDQVTHGAFKPGEYFAYFTHESSMMNIVVFLVAGVYALRHAMDTRLLTNVRVAILAYAVVTGLVYNLLLRNVPYPGHQDLDWPIEVLHVVIPIFVVIDWIIAPGRLVVRWKALWFVAIYPTVWLLFTLVRGVITGWYPYPFLEPSQPGGWLTVLAAAAGVAAVILGFAALGILVTRRGKAQAAS